MSSRTATAIQENPVLKRKKINKQKIKVKVENRFEGGSWEELTNISEEINRLFFS